MSDNVIIKMLDFNKSQSIAKDISIADMIYNVMHSAYLKDKKIEIDFYGIEDISKDFLGRSFSKLYTRIGRDNMRKFIIIKNADIVIFRKLKKMSEEIRSRKNP